jgi:hypothetical protein
MSYDFGRIKELISNSIFQLLPSSFINPPGPLRQGGVTICCCQPFERQASPLNISTFNLSTLQLIHSSTLPLFNLSTLQLFNLSTL